MAIIVVNNKQASLKWEKAVGPTRYLGLGDLERDMYKYEINRIRVGTAKVVGFENFFFYTKDVPTKLFV